MNIRYKLFYLDEVRNDIRNAKQWYADQSDCLEERFEQSAKDAVASIIKMPTAYTN